MGREAGTRRLVTFGGHGVGPGFALLLAIAGGCAPRPSPDAATTLSGVRAALRVDAFLSRSSPLVLHASGTQDKAVEGQGFAPGLPSLGGYAEWFALDPGGGAVRWEYREERFDGTFESYGEIHPEPDRRILLIRDLGIAVPQRGGPWEADARGLRRRLPHLVVDEFEERADVATVVRDSSGELRIGAILDGGLHVELVVDPDTRLPSSVSWDQVVPGRGPVTLRWWWGEYRGVDGVPLPHAYGLDVGGDGWVRLRVDSVVAGGFDAFEPPAILRLLDEQVVHADPSAAPPEPLGLRTLAPGVHTVPDVRSGFAPLVVELDSGLAVVDAPESFPLLGRIPAGETDPAPHLGWHAERLVRFLEERFPATPIRWLVLTHHHADHVGGVRAFVAAGATVVGSEASLKVARELVALDPSVVGDALAAVPRPLESRVVTEPVQLGEGAARIELLPVAPNPHAVGLLVVRLPEPGWMYVSDLVTPTPVERYPPPTHAALDTFFAAWLRARGLEPDTVWSMHDSRPVTPSHLRRALDLPTAGG